MRFLLVSVSGGPYAEPVEIESLEQLVSYVDRDGEHNDIIISKQSLVSKTHDKKQRRAACKYVLCIFDDFIEERKAQVKKERESDG